MEHRERFTYLLDSITYGLKLRVVNPFSSWQHSCIHFLPEANAELMWKCGAWCRRFRL
jgi:hypothetical protein